MRDFPRQKLGELIATYGSSLCDNPMRCRSLLLDSSSNYQLEVDVLINALEEGIVPELRQSTGSMPYVQLLARAARRLQDRRGMTDVAARWAVNSWALALGIISASPGEAVISPDLPTELASYNKVAPTEAAKPGMTPTTGGVPNIYQYSLPPTDGAYPPPPSYVPTDPYASSSPPPPPPNALGSSYTSKTVNATNPPSTTMPAHTPVPGSRSTRTFLIAGIVAVLVIASVISVFVVLSRQSGLTITPTPTPVPYPSLSSAYGGTTRNMTGSLNANVSLTAIAQQQGNVSGNMTVGLPLLGSGPFQGTVSHSGSVHFVVTSNDGSNVTITLTGSIASSGSISGTYSVSNDQGGTWEVTSAVAPVVYPILFANYSGTFANTANGQSGAISLANKSQDQQNFTGNFLVSGVSYPLTGTVGSDNSIQFTITPNGATIKFVGSVNTDGSLSGTYTATTGGNGTWKLLPK